TLDLVARNRERYEVRALTAHTDVSGLAQLARDFGARQAVIGDERLLGALRDALAGSDVEAAAGEGAIAAAAAYGAEGRMAASVGTAGVPAVRRPLEGGGRVALA